MTAGSCLIAFIMLWFIRHCAKYVFWLACLLAIAGAFHFSCAQVFIIITGAVTGGWCLFQEGQRDTTKSNVSQLMTWTGVAVLVAAAVFVMVLCFLRKQLQIALEIVKEAGKAISDMKSLVVFPFFLALLALGYFVLIAYIALNVFSVFTYQKVNTPDSVLKRYDGTNTTNPV